MMAPRASLDGTTLAKGALSPSEVAHRIKEAMEPSRDDAGAILDFVYPVSGHPLMRPEPGYIVFVNFLCNTPGVCHLLAVGLSSNMTDQVVLKMSKSNV